MTAPAALRKKMVDTQIIARGVRDPAVVAAMGSVPREHFVPEQLARFAYDDSPLPIAAGQTISQPYIVAHMIEGAQLRAGDHVLEVGAGSGYAAAILSRIAQQVYAIERQPELAEIARERVGALGYDNVEIRLGDGTEGWPERAPFDAILVAASGPCVPAPLRSQLAIGGRLVMPVGASEFQRLVCVRRTGADAFEETSLGEVLFVPLIGSHGWAAHEEEPHLVSNSYVL